MKNLLFLSLWHLQNPVKILQHTESQPCSSFLYHCLSTLDALLVNLIKGASGAIVGWGIPATIPVFSSTPLKKSVLRRNGKFRMFFFSFLLLTRCSPAEVFIKQNKTKTFVFRRIDCWVYKVHLKAPRIASTYWSTNQEIESFAASFLSEVGAVSECVKK